MSMRISSGILIALALAACSEEKPDNTKIANVEAQQRADADADGRIVCATDGSGDFARVCTMDQTFTANGTILTIHQPDGGFHRLLVTTDGRGVVSADGAEPAKVTIIGQDRIEVGVGDARYRLPAKVGPVAGK